ncbi:competence protein ComEA [Keratinibaculum paraultunense]|uniref:Competence protein ComEA n=1 Tax=Keratinibaculum paraultunense TaxID=1278232 RepID=A0A4R3KZE2_9FIRM|nr:helix-hairpin-helix domain-containing protein [Keratinibaculum paraultunense]QQY80441.1 helix-hairpin-helix domain-containing protein [Keratinibaculum paraultunense]TCS91159.1 competence protein ComEA [Keratinibaculum paraultunense]
MDYFTKKEQIVIILLILIIVLISLFNFLKKNDSLIGKKIDEENKEKVDPEELITELEEQLEDDVENGEIIMVHISGEVYNPGLVELPRDSRVIDAVNLAGGLKKEADLDRINLAKKLEDEEKIYIPKVGEDINPVENFVDMQYDNSSGKININMCTKEELMSLPGIGEVLAGRILEYREQNKFKNIEDIKNVSGIGEKKFESIKELITTR